MTEVVSIDSEKVTEIDEETETDEAESAGEVSLSKDDPLSVDLTMFPEAPTATNTPGDVSTVKEVISKVLLTFPAESVTVIVQSE